ncbi:MAG: ABC transporter transmembrane domain-containing protein, partial [Oscillospiraceae bacterium]|nr:ABC transporter transmembrane domain-containing protein [Oscillospiraceae bacterium]
MKKYLVKYPGLFIVYLAVLLVNQLVVVAVALFLQFVLDSVTAVSNERLITAAFVGLAYITILFIVEQIRRRIASIYMYKTMYRLKSDVFSGVFNTTTSDFNRVNSAQYLSIMNNDVGVVETNYITAFFTIVQFVISMVIAIGVLIWLNPIVALVAVILSLAPLSVPKLFGKKLAASQGQYVQFLGKFNEKIKDY